MAEHRELRGAIIGCGYFSRFHMEAWRRMPDVQIVAACDRELARARAAAPTAYSEAETMFGEERLDFVDIATRPETHLELLRLATGRGVPVLLQKPVAPSWPEVLEAARIARQSDVRVMVHENWRWQRWYRTAQRLISEGAIGTPITYAMRMRAGDGVGDQPYGRQPYFREMPRLVLYEVLIHHIDTARFLLGEIERVYATLRRMNPAIAGEDRALLILQHTTGVDGVIDGHRFLELGQGDVSGDAWIEGDKARLSVDPGGGIWLDNKLVSEGVVGGYRGDSVYSTLRHFVECLRSGEPFETGIEAYLPSVAAMEAGYRSAREGRSVAVTELMTDFGRGATE